MTRILYTRAVADRNGNDLTELPLFSYLAPDRDRRDFSPGGRVIHRRTQWSASLCNVVADLAGLGSVEV